MLDLPNHSKEIKESNFSQEIGTYKVPKGKMDVIFREYKKGNKWISSWKGFVKQGKKYEEFHEYYEELIYNPKEFEKTVKKQGFEILKIFGSRSGEKFNSKNSYRRFYLCKKKG